MIFVVWGGKYKYELEKLARIFLPFEKFEFKTVDVDINLADAYIYTKATEKENQINLFVDIKIDDKRGTCEKVLEQPSSEEIAEREIAFLMYDAFVSITGYRAPWGILTGVRPAKLIGKLISSMGEEQAEKYFKESLLVSDTKTKLCLDCFKSEENIIEKSMCDSFSLYVSIPFCPSRCNYCSFVSHSVEQAKKLIPDYVKLLCREITETAKIVNKLGLKLKTVYIGGGTPTILSADELTEILSTIKLNFDFSELIEYTVEAGRPDTVTYERLEAIKQGGATRISINPQTMDDKVLRLIGRRHSVSDTVDAYQLARSVGFQNINMDIIAGLNGDTVDGFKKTVDKLIELNPENITVHSLSMKRASNLNKSSSVFDFKEGEDAAEMVNYALEKLENAGINPYYMYRQSKTIGNLENVGYAKNGFEGLYNVYIMDETHTILACGASAVTKLREPNGNHIERIFNFKYPYEYISRFDELLFRKQGVLQFYHKFPL